MRLWLTPASRATARVESAAWPRATMQRLAACTIASRIGTASVSRRLRGRGPCFGRRFLAISADHPYWSVNLIDRTIDATPRTSCQGLEFSPSRRTVRQGAYALMPTPKPLPPQIEQFLHDNPQGVLTSFRRNGMPQLSIVTVYPRDGGVGIS